MWRVRIDPGWRRPFAGNPPPPGLLHIAFRPSDPVLAARLHELLTQRGWSAESPADRPAALLRPDQASELSRLLADAGEPELAAEAARLTQWVTAAPAPVTIGPRTFAWGARTYIMGVLNITPDSFSDGGRYLDPGVAVERAWQMVEQGVDVIDIGAESASIAASKPDLDEELRRLVPVVSRLARELPVPISIDTYKSRVAEATLAAGAQIINDITGLQEDPDLAGVVGRCGAAVVVMHLQGRARQVARRPAYQDVLDDVSDYLMAGVRLALAAGVRPERIILDPGIGVGKLTEHNLALLQHLPELRGLGHPVLLGASRTSAIGNVLESPIGDRDDGTAATTAAAAALGVDMVRVHDVALNARAARMADAMARGVAEPADGWPFDPVTGQARRELRRVGGPRPGEAGDRT